MKAVAYIRVSSADQVEGHSLDAQARLFYELCRSRGWEPVGIYREEGKSAHTDSIARRPVFRQLLDDPHTVGSAWWWSTPWTDGPGTPASCWILSPS